jgi:tetratricopeptide (TPR) repeat protein
MRMRRGRTALVIALLGFAVYATSLSNGFMPDDEVIILDNDWVRTGGGLGKLFTREYFEASGEKTYRPVATLFYYLGYRLWERSVAGYHVTAALAHAASCGMVYLVLSRLLARGRPERAGNLVAALAAALFAVHPVNTEAVDAIGYAEDCLALPLMLAAWLALMRGQTEEGWSAVGWSVVACAAFLASLLAKEITVGFPLLAILADVLFRREASTTENGDWLHHRDTEDAEKAKDGPLPRLCRLCVSVVSENRGAYAALLAAAVAFVPLRVWLLRTPFEGGLPYTEGGFGRQLMLTPIILMHYLRLLLFPTRLSGDYELHFRGWGDAEFLAALACLALAGGALVWLARRSRPAALGVGWFFLLLGPSLNLMPMVNPVAERYLYAAAPGFCLAAAAAAARAWRWRRRTVEGLAAAVVVILAALTVGRHPAWGSDRLRNVETVRLFPQCARARLAVGAVYEKTGAFAVAMQEYGRAVALKPDNAYARSYLANLLLRLGQPDRAIAELRRAAQAEPNAPRLWESLAAAYAVKGDRAKATAAQGWAAHVVGQRERALADLECAQGMAPDDVSVLIPLAFVQEAAGRRDQALATWRRVLRLRPNTAEALDAVRRLGGGEGR